MYPYMGISWVQSSVDLRYNIVVSATNSQSSVDSKMNGDGCLHQVIDKAFSEDVLSEILIRLPAKQIGRMRCVCKRWNRILSEPYFIKSHLHRNLAGNKNKDNEILLVLTSSRDDGLMVTAHPSRSPDKNLNDLVKLPANFPRTSNVDWRVIGSVNGLICFHCGFDFDIYIWNPSLSAVMRLPGFIRPSTSSYKLYGFCFRFGFDPKYDDYKVVYLDRYNLEVEVYSMRKGSWGLFSKSFPSNVSPLLSHANKVDGHMNNGLLYWLCPKRSDNCKTIVALDLGGETFFEISLPASLIKSNTSYINHELFIFEGKLCITSYNFDDRVHEIWVMNEYGVTESWVKHHVLSKLNRNIDPLGITLKNEVYFRDFYHDHLALYDPEDTSKVKYFDICHVYNGTRIVQYVDSLVWITPTKKW